MGNKLKAISKVSVALALLGAAVPAVEAAPTAMAAKKATKKAKKSTKKVVKKSTKKAKKAKKTTKKKATKKVAKKPAKKAAKKNTKKTNKKPVKKTVKKAVRKPVKKSTPKKTVKKSTPASANVTFYNIKGKPTSYYVFGKHGREKANMKKGSKFMVLGQATINGQLMYEIQHNPSVYVPAKDVKIDYFKNVVFVDYYDGSGTPAQNKAAYDARLARIENSNPKNSNGMLEWFNAHPLEALRMYSKDTKVSKSTYEKHNLTYAQSAADYGRGSVGFTKESYIAYMNGEAAYRQYEAKWAAKYPNITRSVTKESNTIKKYNLNTFEWHYNDNYYTVDNIRK